jgi:hypothetical protein
MNKPIDREIAALLKQERERARLGPGAATRARVLARVTASAAPHPPSGPAPKMRPSAPAGGAILRSVVAFGVLAGAAAWVATRSGPAPSASVPAAETAPARSEAASTPSPVAPPVASPEPDGAPDRAPAPSATRPKRENPAGTLKEERAILDRARAHLLSGEPAVALGEVEKHARLFRRGVLAEERDALRVEVLVAVRRTAEARAAAARFHAAYPGSMLAPAVDGALRAIP